MCSRLQELNAGLQAFRDELFADSLASKRVEVAIVTFGPVKVECDFTGIQSFIAPHLTTTGDTPKGRGMSAQLRSKRPEPLRRQAVGGRHSRCSRRSAADLWRR